MGSTSISKVNFFTDGVKLSLKNRQQLKKFIEQLFAKEKKKLRSLNYIFCTDRRLLEINREYLKHNYYTDIITFGLTREPAPVEAEVYISLDRVKENALTHNTSFKSELLRVIFHGALHLVGYSDKSVNKAAIMRKMENKYLDTFHY